MTSFVGATESGVGNTLYFQTQSGGGTVGPPTITSPGTASGPGTTISTLTPTMNWIGVTGATGYGIYISQSPYGPSNIIFNNTGGPFTGTSYTLPSGVLQPGILYRWNMTSFVGATESGVGNTLYFQTQSGGGSQELITNGSFDSGIAPWVSQGDYHLITTLPSYHSPPGYGAGPVTSSGTWINNGSGSLSQSFAVPASASTLTISYWRFISTNEINPSIPYDYLYVDLLTLGGSLITQIAQWSNANATANYVQNSSTVNVASYAGQTLALRFTATSDVSYTSVFRIDDVSVIAQ
jgi:hypothetical protein